MLKLSKGEVLEQADLKAIQCAIDAGFVVKYLDMPINGTREHCIKVIGCDKGRKLVNPKDVSCIAPEGALGVLRARATITMPNNYMLRGLPWCNIIELYSPDHDLKGEFDFDEPGLADAWQSLLNFSTEQA